MHTVTKRQFEVNRYRANAYCPCGKSNRKGRFATEKGFSGQPIGHCFTCSKDYWSENDVVEPYKKEVEVLPLCYHTYTIILHLYLNQMNNNYLYYF